ncbi:hypothetical protein BDW75DRAFT_241457 [Aspergillus navahoensis]
MTEISIGAVTRVFRFTQDTHSVQERCMYLSIVYPGLLHDWPEKGAVEITVVNAGYGYVWPLCLNTKQPLAAVALNLSDSHSTVPILKDLTMSIQPGGKNAVCVQSGSEKTLLVMAILKMLDYQAGHNTVDAQDLAEIMGSTLCSRNNVVPQGLFFMLGTTLFFNFDPCCEVVGDAVLTCTFGKVGLWHQIRATGGLEMGFAAADWSVGQKAVACFCSCFDDQEAIIGLHLVGSPGLHYIGPKFRGS